MQETEEVKPKNLYQKLLEVKKRIPYLHKNADGFNFKYADPIVVLTTINPILNEFGILLKSEVVNSSAERVFTKKKYLDLYGPQGKEKVLVDIHETLFHLEFRFTWIDVETGEKDVNLWRASGMNGDEQGAGSACTYAERYFILKYFNIPTGDDDPDALSNKKKPETTSKLDAKPSDSNPTENNQQEDPRPWMTEKALNDCKARIKKGEADVYLKADKAFRMKKQYRDELRNYKG